MKIIKTSLVIVFILLVIIYAVRTSKEAEKQIEQQEKLFQKAARKLIADIDNNQLKLMGPKEVENIRNIIQTKWILVSPLSHNDSYYAFEIYRLPMPDSSKKWIIMPCFYSPTKNEVEDWLGYHVEVFDDQLFDPELLNSSTYYREYKNEPFYSTFRLLQKFVKRQKNQAKH